MPNKPKDESFVITDVLEEGSTTQAIIEAEMKKLKQCLIIGVKTFDKGKEERADGSSQKGRWLYEVQGESSTYTLGANVLSSVAINAGVDIRVSNTLKQSFLNSTHFTKLQSAYHRQKGMRESK